MTTVESALQDARIEYVEETTEGETPTDPAWEVLTDYLDEFTFSPGAGREGIEVVGQGDIKDMFRAAEEPEATTSYYKQEGFVGSSGDPLNPAGEILTYDYTCDLQSYTFEYRRETTCDGNFDAGFREYAVLTGAKPVEVTDPGDPSAANPIIEDLSWDVGRARAYVIHQPDSSTTLDVENQGSDSVDVTIEDEGAATSETVTVSGGSTVTTTSTFDNVDAIFAESEHDGDIVVTDGSGTNVLDSFLAGTDTDGVESERGVPPLGAGSHGSAIGTDPTEYQFIGVDQINYNGGSLSDRIHALDLTVSIDTSREPVQGSRRTAIDVGMRSVEIDADTAGPFETAERIQQQFHNISGDFVYSFPDNDVTVNNAEMTSAPDYTRSAGDANYIPSATWQGKTDSDASAIDVTYTGA